MSERSKCDEGLMHSRDPGCVIRIRIRAQTSATRSDPGSRIPGIVTHHRSSASREMMALHISQLWRYPVKSLAGEPLSATVIGPDGIPGDRIVRVRGPEGVRTARRQYRLLGLRGTLG